MKIGARLLALLAVTFFLIAPSAAFAEKKIALLMANSKYSEARENGIDLPDVDIATSEIKILSDELRLYGFTTFPISNYAKDDLDVVKEKIKEAARSADVILFYYVGHGREAPNEDQLIIFGDGSTIARYKIEEYFLKKGESDDDLIKQDGVVISVTNACRGPSETHSKADYRATKGNLVRMSAISRGDWSDLEFAKKRNDQDKCRPAWGVEYDRYKDEKDPSKEKITPFGLAFLNGIRVTNARLRDVITETDESYQCYVGGEHSLYPEAPGRFYERKYFNNVPDSDSRP